MFKVDIRQSCLFGNRLFVRGSEFTILRIHSWYVNSLLQDIVEGDWTYI